MEYVIGIDGGGTKTTAIVLDSAGRPISEREGAATNPHAVTFAAAIDNLAQLLQELYFESGLIPSRCTGIGMGIAGVSTNEEQQLFLDALLQDERLRLWDFKRSSLPILIRNDAEIALMAAITQETGTIVISGTGAIVLGITPNGERFRTGGWGHILGDKGSGYEIGLQTLQAVMLSHDGVLPPTLLTEHVLDKHQFDSPEQLRSYIYGPSIRKQHIAQYAELCIRAANQGDEAAQRIIKGAAADLAQLALAMRSKDIWLSQAPLAVTGSIFKHSDLYLDTFTQCLKGSNQAAMIVLAEKAPAWGAAMLVQKHLLTKEDTQRG
ncbi:ATPase [Paenibacillus sp. SC116]|uniref:N-acetylglucosamine kinase n=1 Tax=Paenibacillus sp. SC116 TaxID=2968986 RepID=UPI00215A2B81|nr:BadF/BadG/BcrA/BcrD ATPase family protein [Paenibacillus sp. SC116]MCR8843460.1 ATPase [Paenibacillus sp. SC116]